MGHQQLILNIGYTQRHSGELPYIPESNTLQDVPEFNTWEYTPTEEQVNTSNTQAWGMGGHPPVNQTASTQVPSSNNTPATPTSPPAITPSTPTTTNFNSPMKQGTPKQPTTPTPTHSPMRQKDDLVGKRVSEYWKDYGRWYEGTVEATSDKNDSGSHNVRYDDEPDKEPISEQLQGPGKVKWKYV